MVLKKESHAMSRAAFFVMNIWRDHSRTVSAKSKGNEK